MTSPWKICVVSLIAASVMGAVLLVAMPAHAQAKCAPRNMMVEQLKSKYGESVVAMGILNSGPIVAEFWLNPENGSWTLTTSDQSGKMCVQGDGQKGTYIEPAIVPTGAPA